MRNMSVLFVQLPAGGMSFNSGLRNSPVAAGFLKAMAYKAGLLEQADIEILDTVSSVLRTDRGLIDAIVRKKPDVLCFSLYMWNSLRSLHIAAEVKKELADVVVVVGGLDVTLESAHVMGNDTIDIGCIGAGEESFVDILAALIAGKKDFGHIRGILCRTGGKLAYTSPRPAMKGLDAIPSPYKLGFIDVNEYKMTFYESTRGCRCRCTYCSEGAREDGVFSRERVLDDLRFLIEKGVAGVYMGDSSFYRSPYFRDICQMVRERNSAKKTEFYGNIYLEDITETDARLLKECNFKNLEVGVQSINESVLRAVNRRPFNREKFMRGFQILKDQGLDIVMEMIVGLPTDTLDGLKRTMGFMNEINATTYTALTRVLPGTRLWHEAERYGMKSRREPGYELFESATMSKADIAAARQVVGGYGIPNPLSTLSTYCTHELGKTEKKSGKKFGFDGVVSRVVIETGGAQQTKAGMKRLGEKLGALSQRPFTVWLRGDDMMKGWDLGASFIDPISKDNPFMPWYVVLESGKKFDTGLVDRVMNEVATREKVQVVLFKAVNISCVLAWKTLQDETAWVAELGEKAPVFWSYEVKPGAAWKKDLGKIYADRAVRGVVMDLSPAIGLEDIRSIHAHMEKLRGARPGFEVYYKNIALVYSEQACAQNGRQMSVKEAKRFLLEPVVVVDGNMEARRTMNTDFESSGRMMLWQRKVAGAREPRVVKPLLYDKEYFF